MTRVNKKTRIKGLPPRIFLQQKSARTGSLPSISRIPSDNRTGHFRTIFDDNSTIVFSTGSTKETILGASIPLDLTESVYYQEFGQDITTSLSTTEGSVIKGIADEFIAFTPGQAFEPFKEHGEPAVTGKSLSYVTEPKINFSNLF